MQRYQQKQNQNVYICYFYIKIESGLQKSISDYKNLCFLNSNDGSGLLAFGSGDSLRINEDNCFDQINHFINENSGSYIFSCFSYDLKNGIENLKSENTDDMGFPSAILWRPSFVVKINLNNIEFVQGTEQSGQSDLIRTFLNQKSSTDTKESLEFNPRTTKEKYIETVNLLKEHIQRGDLYEINYCQEYISYNVDIKDITNTYLNLNNITKTPFSSLFQFDEFAIFCCSPERFIKKTDAYLIAQPIKGTAKRGLNEAEDQELIQGLKSDPKERSENIMIVDLMRNDLSKIAEIDSVKVNELCEVYSFETVHQMISTVSCTVKNEISFKDILKATFPMGSMTGAPKIRAMELIEQYEDFKRGLYSGSIGYISPNGDFDFNVIIRTMIYNQLKKTLSCGVGSAITIKSDAQKEYEECEMKIKKMIDVIKN